MKTSFPHVIATKRLRCNQRKFQLSSGTLIFLKNASRPMIEWLQEVHTNDSEALLGDTDALMSLETAFTKVKKPKTKLTKTEKLKFNRKQLYFKLRPPCNE